MAEKQPDKESFPMYIVRTIITLLKSKITQILILMYFCFLCGNQWRELKIRAGVEHSPETQGSMIKITGKCKVNSNDEVSLFNDIVKVVKETENEIEAVSVDDVKSLRCSLSHITVDTFVVSDLFDKRKVPSSSPKETREIVQDPIMLNLKKTVSISGICNAGKSKSEVILSDKVIDVLDIKEDSKNGFIVTALMKTSKKEITCQSERIKMNQILEADVQAFLDKEAKDGVSTITSYKGRTIAVTGLCAKRVDGEMAKGRDGKPELVDLASLPVKVTEETVTNGVVQRIYGKALDEKRELISLECSKELDHGLLFEEITEPSPDKEIKDGVKTIEHPVNLKVTGKCRNQNGKMTDLYDQTVKAVSSSLDRDGTVNKAVIKIKKEDGTIETLECDKRNSVIFDKAE